MAGVPNFTLKDNGIGGISVDTSASSSTSGPITARQLLLVNGVNGEGPSMAVGTTNNVGNSGGVIYNSSTQSWSVNPMWLSRPLQIRLTVTDSGGSGIKNQGLNTVWNDKEIGLFKDGTFVYPLTDVGNPVLQRIYFDQRERRYTAGDLSLVTTINRNIFVGGSFPRLVVRKSNIAYCGYYSQEIATLGSFLLVRSRDYFRTLEAIGMVWEAGYFNTDFGITRDGTGVSVAMKRQTSAFTPVDIWFRTSSNLSSFDSSPILVTTISGAESTVALSNYSMRLVLDESEGRAPFYWLYVGNAGIVLLSKDGGLTWGAP